MLAMHQIGEPMITRDTFPENSICLQIVGFGNQASVWAMNLRDSGAQVDLFLRNESPSIARAKELGFPVQPLEEARFKKEAPIFLGIPDDQISSFLNKGLVPLGSTLIFAHGFALESRPELKDQFNCLLLAPKAIASELRLGYELKKELAAFYSTEFSSNQEDDERLLLILANALGITKTFQTSFEQETLADLFSEQSILCSLLPYAAISAYRTSRQAGISKELAYFECWYELKLIMDTLISQGPQNFMQMISPNALKGSVKGMKSLQARGLDKYFDALMEELKSGKFYQELNQMDYSMALNEAKLLLENPEFAQLEEEMRKELKL